MSPPRNIRIGRRRFLRAAALSGIAWGLGPMPAAKAVRRPSANERLNIGVVGVAGRGADNLQKVSGENVVAICDVDDERLAAAAAKHPQAETYNDFRRLLDRNDLDAVVCSTPDHTHAVVSTLALRGGRHVYCEKPLARTVSECRVIREAARGGGRVTQMGTQIHAGTNYRRAVELVQRGVIGPVAEVHVWVNVSYGGMERPSDTPPVPAGLHYDLWLGPVEPRPYHPAYLPGRWRNWWAFGGGGLGDFGCHYLDLPHWALDLRNCSSVEVVDGPPVHPETVPPWLVVRYEYPGRGDRPPVRLTWYHGGRRPDLLRSVLSEPGVEDGGKRKPWPSGVLFVGTKGMLLADYTRHRLLPQEAFAGFEPPDPFIPDSIGHHEEWIAACKQGGATSCDFDYSGALSETVLLGNVAYRAGAKVEWDAAGLLARNGGAAQRFVQHRYRKGWRI
ncbi:MAG: Gfo/Idh/MocA family oxidoreductase [Lentisphaerae bacterium]|nr:Gfo/Idh/MocA family oxidoreductase [Lentisphaerota bacterium]